MNSDKKIEDIVTRLVENKRLDPAADTVYYDVVKKELYTIDHLQRVLKAKAEKAESGYKTIGPWKTVGAYIAGQVRLAPKKEKKQRVQDKQHLSLYVNPDEAEIIAQAAAISGKTMSGWCREKLVDAAREFIANALCRSEG